MRHHRRAASLILAVGLLAASLPVAAADPSAPPASPVPTQAPLTMDGPPITYSDENPGWDAKRCPKVRGKGKRKDCLQAADGSVRVVFGGTSATRASVRDVIRAGWEGMHRYRTFGFTSAAIGPDNPLIIALEAGDSDPYYSWKSGVVYLGEGAAKQLAGADAGGSLSARLELWHELFHWVQDEEYAMGLAALTGGDTWWMETTAEVATFLIEPAGAPRNARLYGHSTHGAVNVSQLSPSQWPGNELYQHAQRLLASMYSSTPALTVSEFVAAINSGTYALNSRWQRFTAGIDEYAEYLLTGSLPGFGVVGPIASGTAFGDFIGVVAERNGKAGAGMRLLGNNDKPQIDRDAGTVNAVMQRNSVYALAVVSGTRYAAWEGSYPAATPAKMTVEPGPPFFYRVDGGPVQQHDGSSELVLDPIAEGRGIGEVRIVAVAKDAGATFKAKIEKSDIDPGGTAQLVHSLLNLDPDEQGSGVLVCPYVGEAVLRMNGGMWRLSYVGENWHRLEGPVFVCGGGEGGGLLAGGTYTLDPFTLIKEDRCDRDEFSLDETTMTMSGTTYGSCPMDSDVYTYELTFEPPATYFDVIDTMAE